MIKREIKTAEQFSQLAEELVQDMRDELAVYGSYKVIKEEVCGYYNVSVVDANGAFNIITEAVIRDVQKVVGAYDALYKVLVSYHAGTVEDQGMQKVAIVIVIKQR
jgi:hypothetical protein